MSHLFVLKKSSQIEAKKYLFLSDLSPIIGYPCHNQCPAGRVVQYRVGSGRVLNKIPGSRSGSGRVGVSKNTILYFRVPFLLSGISGYLGYFRVCWVFSGISWFTHIY